MNPVDARAELAKRELKKRQAEKARKEAIAEMNADMNAGESFLVSAGRGLTSLARGVGLVDPEDASTRRAYENLEEQRPISTTAGYITGQAAPFAPFGAAVGAIPSVAGRVLAGGAVGATEGGAISLAEGDSVSTGAGVGGVIGGTVEALFPVLSRLGGSLYRKLTGKAIGADVIDQNGVPTPEFQEVLEQSGITMDDLVDDARAVVERGGDPQQVARAAQFAQEGIPATRGDVTQALPDQAVEARLVESASDSTAEGFRQYRLRQSNAIKEALERSVDTSLMPEGTGEALKQSLIDRKSLLRTQKNALYKAASEQAESFGGLPLYTDEIEAALPDGRKLKQLNRVSKGAVDDVMDTLAEFGIVAREGIEDIDPLSITNFEDLRSALLAIQRGDQSGATGVIIGPIIDALDNELDNVAEYAPKFGASADVVDTLKKARAKVRELKTEFDPKSLVGQMVENRAKSTEPVVYASKAYSKITSKATPVEGVRKVVASLKQSPNGAAALADLQTTTMLDLVNAGFSTASRKIDGVTVFNPGAFNKHIETIGRDKLEAILPKELMNRINNISSIARNIQPTAGAVPKGSASVILDVLNKLGISSITAKIPGANIIYEGITKLAEGAGNRSAAQAAISAMPVKERGAINELFPGVAAALGISAVANSETEARQ